MDEWEEFYNDIYCFHAFLDMQCFSNYFPVQIDYSYARYFELVHIP